VEAGHYPNDYAREVTRRYVFQSLLTALHYISSHEITGSLYRTYFDIPENKKLYYDIIIRKALINSKLQDIGILYQERLIHNKIEFIPIVEKISNLKGFFGHKEINANNNVVFTHDLKVIEEGVEIDFVSIKNDRISLNL
jgi:hypothetical protein